MSFSSSIKEELNKLHIKNNCCKKSFLLGAMLSAEKDGDSISLKITDQPTVSHVTELLKTVFKTDPKTREISRGCYKATELRFRSAKLSEFLSFADEFSDSEEDNERLDGYFHCQECKNAFMRAAFCTKGSISEPHKSYSLEIQVNNDTRAMLLHSVFESVGSEAPGIGQRRASYFLFFKNEDAVQDALAVFGSSNCLQLFWNTLVEKDLRNSENRATNCVMRNIAKSVSAASKQIEAIEALISCGLFEEMSDDLKTTASLRLANPLAGLSELAELHTPPISKSGLNHRLQRITDKAKENDLI